MARAPGDRVSRLAVNVADLLRPELRVLVDFMLAPVIQGRGKVRVGTNVDDWGVVLECDEQRGLAILDSIALATKRHGIVVRSYVEGPRGGWKRRPS